MSGRNKYDLAYHFIFGTKRKAPVLDDESLLSLQLLFSIKAKELGGELITSGGHKDHVHLLFMAKLRTHLGVDLNLPLSEFQ